MWHAVARHDRSERCGPQSLMAATTCVRVRLRHLGLTSPQSIVVRRPMSSKCASRKRRVARWPSLCRLSKNSKSVLSLLRRVERAAWLLHRDAMQPQSPELAVPGAARQPALVDQLADELDRAQLRQQRGVEGDLVHPAHDLPRRHRHLARAGAD